MFIAQPTLEIWMDSGNVEMRGDEVVLKKLKRTYVIESAVRFVAVVSGGAAPKLIGKVLTERRIGELGGEIMGDSVIIGDSAFQVQPGFVATLKEAPDKTGTGT
jgi:hypothetical protein